MRYVKKLIRNFSFDMWISTYSMYAKAWNTIELLVTWLCLEQNRVQNC